MRCNYLCLLSTLTSSSLYAETPTLAQSVRAAIVDTIQREQPVADSGVSVAVFSSNDMILLEGFGFKDRERHLPATPETLYAIGSTTKAFTAMGIMKLVERGRLTLDDRAKDALPGFRLATAERTDQVKVVDLLSHAVGMPRHDITWYLTPFGRQELVARLPYLPLNPKPGYGYREAFQYNNLMFLALGEIVEGKSGSSWEGFVADEILNPLGMASTFFDWPSAKSHGDYAEPYTSDVHLDHKDVGNICPAGCIVSNVVDLSKWVQLHLRHGKLPNGDAMISEETEQEFFKKRMPILPDRPELGYGLAWMIQEGTTDFPTAYFHGGNIDGFTAMVFFTPSIDLGVVVLSNQTSTRVPNDIAVAVVDAILKARRVTHSERRLRAPYDLSVATLFEQTLGGETHEAHNDRATGLNLAPQIGRYSDPGYSITKIRQGAEGLLFDYYGHIWPMTEDDQHKWTVEAIITKEDSPFGVNFEATDSGEIFSLEVPWETEVPSIRFVRDAATQELSRE